MVLKDARVCLAFAKQVKAWKDAGSIVPSLVVSLAFPGKVQSFHSSPIDGRSSKYYLLQHLPNLANLDLGGEVETTSDVLLQLMMRPLPLQSLVGVGLSSSNYDAVFRVLSSASGTLRNVSLVSISSLQAVSNRDDAPSVDLPLLRRLNIVPSSFDNKGGIHIPLELGLKASDLRLLTIGLGANWPMGEMVRLCFLLNAFRKSVEEFSAPMWSVISPGSLQDLLVGTSRVKTLAFHFSESDLWLERDEEKRRISRPSFPTIRTLIFVQESSEGPMDSEIEVSIFRCLNRLLSKETCPSLERVYYVTEDGRGPVWNV